jgi:hypothetical protein
MPKNLALSQYREALDRPSESATSYLWLFLAE